MGSNPPRPGPRPRQDPNWSPPPAVRILMVCDDEYSYDADHKFGLTELIDSLQAPSLLVKFAVTRAHREASAYAAKADIQAFRFDNPAHFNPSNFDEIWFFGLRHAYETASPLSAPELRKVSEFMDSGGGVFATGDHEDLGAALCGQIPRVRSMRKWAFDYAVVADSYEHYNPGSGDGPPVFGSFRHDTLMAGHDPVFTFDDQSDDVAAPIIPTMYGTGGKLFQLRFPHPLLCGPRGVIEILPDHMHEGECIVPATLDLSTTFDGYTSPEYPAASGIQSMPDVVARGIVTAHETDNTALGSIQDVASTPKQFGCIGAYDGRPVGVGRVVVDSTFHHFVNINIDGTGSDSSDPVKQQGFYASPQGLEQFTQIQAYWRNIAIWLAPATVATAMFHTALWAARWDPQVRMVTPGLAQNRTSWRNLVAYGTVVHTAIARFWSPCAAFDWFFAGMAAEHPLAKYSWWLKLILPDPPPYDHLIVSRPELVTGAVGHLMAQLVATPPGSSQTSRDALGQHLPRMVEDSYRSAWRAAAHEAEQMAAATRTFFASLQA